MSKWLLRGALVLAWLGPMGCADTKFESAPNATCVQYQRDFGQGGCVVTPSGYQFNYRVTSGEVDMLFVDDNSGSMYPEQVEMANRFPGFLDSIYRLDYRIAVITTDIYNNGGGFLSFPNGGKYLSNKSRVIDAKHNENITQFQNTIKRSETIDCDTFRIKYPGADDPDWCPSGDERGIYAMNLAIARGDQRSFFRSGGHLAVVILSDEDERSNGGNFSGFELQELDTPLSFVQRTKTYLGATKSVSVHSIIIRPGDTYCHSLQNSQSGVKGFYGYSYAALSNPDQALRNAGNIVGGELGNICSSNYTTELGNIAARLNQHQPPVLPCMPENGQVQVSYDPSPGVAISYSIDSSRRLHLSPVPTAGQHVNLSFKCKYL